MSSLYAEYLKERTSDEILETSAGFATYRHIPNEEAVYIIDIYIKPNSRKTHLATSMANRICEIAKKEWNCKKVIGTISPSAKNSTESIKVLVAYGMKLKSSHDNCIVMEKDI